MIELFFGGGNISWETRHNNNNIRKYVLMAKDEVTRHNKC